MARPGNNNALRHGIYRARQERDRHRRKAERAWREVLVECGLLRHKLAKIIAGEAAFLLGLRLRITSYLEARGFFKRDQEMRPALAKAVEVSNGLIDRCGRMIEQLQAIQKPEEAVDRVFVCELADGTPAFALRPGPGEEHVPFEHRAPLAAGAVQEARSPLGEGRGHGPADVARACANVASTGRIASAIG